MQISGLMRAGLLAGLTAVVMGQVPDVVFAREFGVTQASWRAPDSGLVAWMETVFPDANHYIVPGGRLPVFRLKITDGATVQSRTVAETNGEWAYLLRVAWSPDSRRLVFYRMNRLQNLAELCAYQDGVLKTLLTEKDAYWVNAPETPVFVDGGRLVVSSERSGHKRVYLYGADGRLVRDLTPAGLEVDELHAAFDGRSVFVSGSEGMRQERQLYRLKLDGGGAEQMTREPGWHEVRLNADGSGYSDRYSSLVKPPAVEWHGSGGPRALQTDVEAPAASLEKPVANEFFTIQTHDHVALPARLFKPDGFDAQKKYPVILYTFSGPRGRVVKDAWGGWEMTWNRSMVRRGFLVLAVDVRGSGGYGHSFEEYIHYRFGAQEVADLREVVDYLRRQGYVDGERLGIWGRGYGGHTVVQAMWQFPGGFQAGFAESPISDWKKYDAYFTERYLGLPANRFNEYNDSSPLENARKMTGTLMVTGPPDDPVIQKEQWEALETAMARVKDGEVRKRFAVVAWPNGTEKLMAQMTEFFERVLGAGAGKTRGSAN